MSKAVIAVIFGLLIAVGAQAQELRALARLDLAASSITDSGDGVDISLTLTQAVPYRLYTLDQPMRLVMEFREVAFEPGLDGIETSDAIVNVSSARVAQGRSVLVLGLAGPMQVARADLRTVQNGRAAVNVRLTPVGQAEFVAKVQPSPTTIMNADAARDMRLVVALDPGHGGTDTGLAQGDATEAQQMLQFARELKEALLRGGVDEVVLTRDADRFTALPARISTARAAQADLLLSLHAMTSDRGLKGGIAVYTLSPDASARAAAQSAQGQDRRDILRGIDLRRVDDEVAGVLMGIARLDTDPLAVRLAEQLVTSFSAIPDQPQDQSPLKGGFSVLKAPDIPSVLIEFGGLLQNPDDVMLRDPVWRRAVADAVVEGVTFWALDTAARSR